MKRMLLALTLSVFLAAFWVVGTATAGSNPTPPIQVVGQSGTNDQTAVAASDATQQQPQNQDVSVRVLSPGNDGSVSQTNTVQSGATASNANAATQNATQAASSAGCGCSAPLQVAGQLTGGQQGAGAMSAAAQQAASNGAAPTDVLSPNGGGGTTQGNSASSTANSGNSNGSGQAANQAASGSGTQIADQNAANDQTALAESQATQTKPQNSNISIRVLSPGNDGSVSQTNAATSDATASNTNAASQGSGQTSSGGSGAGTQIAKQDASNDQAAGAASTATQTDPSNNNVSVRVLSPGDNGSVSQSNTVKSDSKATNANSSNQSATQSDPSSPSCGCSSGSPVQIAIQNAQSAQQAVSLSGAEQDGASNSNKPIRILSPGTDGSVTQSNTDTSSASSSNTNGSGQTAIQNAVSGGCCGSSPIQVIGQSAENDQGAGALSAALQKGASNSNDPLRVLSPGGGGSVKQTNAASSDASSSNSNSDTQNGMQTALGGSCCGRAPIQVIGELAKSSQTALAESEAQQIFGEKRSECGCVSAQGNVNDPKRVLSPGTDGSVSQENTASSTSRVANTNSADQLASQFAGPRPCGCGGSAIQVIGQQGLNHQLAAALSLASQFGAFNSTDPARILSPGGGGSSNQANGDSSLGSSTNGNRLGQGARQFVL
jgi:hypothetical protein